MTIARARGYLALVFIGGLALQAVATIFSYLERAIAVGDVTNLLYLSLTVYSVPLAVISGGIFARKMSSAKFGKAPIAAFSIAIVGAIIWNILLVWRFAAFAYAAVNPTLADNAANLSAYVDSIAKASLFLVSGALTYFFASKS